MKGILIIIFVITARCLIPVEASPSQDSAPDSGITESRGFDVFLNFRGPDSRYTVIDILYKTLTDAGVRVFLDDEHIRKGEVIEGELLEAIAHSRIYIAILSKDYASSKWCLRELVMMIDFWKRSRGEEQKIILDCSKRSIGQKRKVILDCWERSINRQKNLILDFLKHSSGQEKRVILDCREHIIGEERKVILPIFHGVSVSKDVKLRSEVYTSALQKHKEKLGEEVVKLWEDALKEVAMIKGWNLQDHGLSELANLVKNWVLSEINANLDRKRLVGQDGVSVSKDVKLRSEVYTSALQKHREKLGEVVVKPSEDALKEVATIKGWNLRDNSLSKVANLIKKRVLSDINANEAIPSVPDRLAGIKDWMEDIILKLQPIFDAKHCKPKLVTIMVVILTILPFKHIESVKLRWFVIKQMFCDEASATPGARFIVIHVRGGIGNTELADDVFQDISSTFQGSYFLRNIRGSPDVREVIIRYSSS